MSERKFKNKPACPAPPVNALKKPSVRTAGNEPQEELMVNISDPGPSDAVKINEPEEEVKVYVPAKSKPDKKQKPEKQKKRRTGVWIAVIASILALGLAASGVYMYLNGFFG